MTVIIEMISNWVSRSVVVNGCLMVVDSKSELCSRFTYIMIEKDANLILYDHNYIIIIILCIKICNLIDITSTFTLPGTTSIVNFVKKIYCNFLATHPMWCT